MDPKLAALLYRFWYRWGNNSQTRSNIEVFHRKLRDHFRGEKVPAIQKPRIAPWWKPTSDSDSSKPFLLTQFPSLARFDEIQQIFG